MIENQSSKYFANILQYRLLFCIVSFLQQPFTVHWIWNHPAPGSCCVNICQPFLPGCTRLEILGNQHLFLWINICRLPWHLAWNLWKTLFCLSCEYFPALLYQDVGLETFGSMPVVALPGDLIIYVWIFASPFYLDVGYKILETLPADLPGDT